MSELPVVCTLTDSRLQRRRDEILTPVRERIEEIRQLDSGYALRFSSDDVHIDKIVEMIKLERECCLFLEFKLTFEPNRGPVWVEVTGPAGTKEFLEAELVHDR